MSMTLKDRIPKEFYSLFRTKNMDAYVRIIVAIYEENNEVYASFGLTREECFAIIEDTIEAAGIVWLEDETENAGCATYALLSENSRYCKMERAYSCFACK